MCDTMVALGNATADGSVIFAKNSDRSPNEPHILIRVPRRQHYPGSKVKCTYIEVDQVEETNEVFLLKPSWIWGCEMGANEFGLNIGNEAVFTKEKQDEPCLIGMDLIRLALERCRTSEEALNLIVELLQRYGQGGNCGYDKKFTYHNSFLIADKNSAWVLETAGKYWAAKQVKDVYSISNGLTIDRDYDRCHPNLIEHAIGKGWCEDEEDFSFAYCYGDPVVTRFSGAIHRRRTSMEFLQAKKGEITADTMKKILRTHYPVKEGRQFSSFSLRSICMHAGSIIGDHTTGSYIASLGKDVCTYWVTGSSTPCLSIFKPYWMVEGEKLTFPEEQHEQAVAYWNKREQLHRLVIENRIPDVNSYLLAREGLEADFSSRVAAIDSTAADPVLLRQILHECMLAEQALLDETLASAADTRSKIKGTPYFRRYWKKKNRIFRNSNDMYL